MVVTRESVSPIDFGGLGNHNYTAGLEASSSFAMITIPPGVAHADSWSRRSDKYYYVVTGTVEFADSGQTHVLSAGDSCLVSQGGRFSYRNRSEAPATDTASSSMRPDVRPRCAEGIAGLPVATTGSTLGVPTAGAITLR